MKSFYIVLIGFAIISCKSQNKQSQSDSTGKDSTEAEIKTDSSDVKSVAYCSELVRQILKTSPRYKQITDGLLKAVKKNGGTSVDIVIDKSPEEKKDNPNEYSANYEMQVTENYPDRQVSIAHFRFNPKNNQLYEYDVVRDKLNVVEFDNTLLNNVEKYCK